MINSAWRPAGVPCAIFFSEHDLSFRNTTGCRLGHVKLNKIYTKTGDKGTTGLGTGERVRKDALRISAYGTVERPIP